MAPNSKFEWALDHAKRGCPVLPLHFVNSGGRCSCGAPKDECKPGKHPLVTSVFKKGYHDATLDIELIKNTWSQYPQANIGWALGKVVVVDTDNRHGGKESLEVLEERYGPLPLTVTALTGSGDGSQHRFYQVLDGVKPENLNKIDGLPGLELKVNGYVVAVGSATTQPYVWQPGAGPDDIPFAPIPDWLAKLSQQPFNAEKAPGVDDAKTDKPKKQYPPLTAGENKKALAKALKTCAFLQHCAKDAVTLSEPEWQAMVELLVFFGPLGELKIHELSQPYPTYSESATNKKIANAIKAIGKKRLGPYTCEKIEHSLGFKCPSDCFAMKLDTRTPVTTAIKAVTAREPWHTADTTDSPKFNLTDVGNAERFVKLFGLDVRYCLERERWLYWNGKYWEWDWGNRLAQLAKKTALSINNEIATEPEDIRRKELRTWAKLSEGDHRLNALLNRARYEADTPLNIEQLDTDPWLLNVNNGTINLQTGKLQPYTREDLITRIIPIDYKPQAESALWQDVLHKVFNGNAELIVFLKRALGHSITGLQSLMVLFFCHGGGFNGKSTLLGAILDVLGPYGYEIEPQHFMTSRIPSSGPNEVMASLYRIRYVCSTEIEEGQRLSVGLVKRLTGGEALRHERKYEHGFSFKPEFKLWLSGNHEPIISDTTNSIWGRLKKIPFLHHFPPQERIEGLRQQLVKEHGEAILAWLVEGCLEWQSGGLREPKDVVAATKGYRESQDLLHDFIVETCIVESSATVLVSELYKEYEQWCDENGEKKPLGKINFSNRLREKGLETRPGAHNKSQWHGIKIAGSG